MLGAPAVVRSPRISPESLAFISAQHSLGIGGSGESQSTPFDNQCGPFIQSLVRPLEGMSAGLSLPAQCIQCSGFNSFLISETLFCTKGFQLFSTPRIQKSDTVESVKHQEVDKVTSP